MDFIKTCSGLRIIKKRIRKTISFNLATSIDGVFGAWSGKGCIKSKVQKYDGYLTCECKHLTNFALLLDVSQKKANPLALSIVTWIGCGVSMLGLVLTIISYLCFKYVWLSLYLIGLSFNISISLITFWFIVFAIRDVFRTLSNIYSLNIYLKYLTTTLNGTDLSNYLTLPVGDSIFKVSNIEVSQIMTYKTYGLFS